MARLNLGRDSPGRPLVVDATTRDKVRRAQKQLGHRLTIVQGSYMGANGADASADTHSGGGVIDIRTWDLGNITPSARSRCSAAPGSSPGTAPRSRAPTPTSTPSTTATPTCTRPRSARSTTGRRAITGSRAAPAAPTTARAWTRVDAPRDVPTAKLGLLTKAGIDRWIKAEEAAAARPTAAPRALVAALRAGISIDQLRAARTWKVELKTAAERAGRKKEAEGQPFRIALIDALIIKKGA